MTEYIEREEIYRRWNAMPAPASAVSLSAAIQQTPAADVAPVRHGRWEMLPYTELYKNKCSSCGNGSDLETDYCPKCGAKMGKEA